jgi:hypothetical protein
MRINKVLSKNLFVLFFCLIILSLIQNLKNEQLECDFHEFISKTEKFMIISILTAPRPVKNKNLDDTLSSMHVELSKFTPSVQKKV